MAIIAKPGAGFMGLRIFLAAVLLTAAGLKAYQLATEPVLAESVFTSRWFLWLAVQAEFGFGLWMLLGPFPQALWRAAILLFVTLGVVSIARMLSGASTCGCFGRLQVNPLWIGLFDFGAAGLLLVLRPDRHFLSDRATRMRVCALFGLWLLIGIPVGVVAASGLTTEVQAAGVTVAGNVVILEPNEWVGKQLPVLSQLDNGDMLRKGEWILLFYHHDCPACEAVLPGYIRLGKASQKDSNRPRIALVELPPYADGNVRFEACEMARLTAGQDWFMTTPCEIYTRDGLVLSVE